jgi:pyrimidine and pyridine-specific 5'-nucleotidase
MRTALDTVHKAHARALQRYRRLLERTQSASSAQLHALQAELRMLKQGGSPGAASVGGRMIGMGGDEDGVCTCGARNGKRGGYWAGLASDPNHHGSRGLNGDGDDEDEDPDLLEALRGARGEFSERAVRRAIRGLSRDERMRLSVRFLFF